MKKILVVEDDQRIAKALSVRLTHAGYDVAIASDGLEGLKSAIQLKPDLIISDIWMPGAVGFLLAERIKAFGLGSVPVIFITANKKKNLTRLAKEVGAAHFFEKPYDPEELLATIDQIFNASPSFSRTRESGERLVNASDQQRKT